MSLVPQSITWTYFVNATFLCSYEMREIPERLHLQKMDKLQRMSSSSCYPCDCILLEKRICAYVSTDLYFFIV